MHFLSERHHQWSGHEGLRENGIGVDALADFVGPVSIVSMNFHT